MRIPSLYALSCGCQAVYEGPERLAVVRRVGFGSVSPFTLGAIGASHFGFPCRYNTKQGIACHSYGIGITLDAVQDLKSWDIAERTAHILDITTFRHHFTLFDRLPAQGLPEHGLRRFTKSGKLAMVGCADCLNIMD